MVSVVFSQLFHRMLHKFLLKMKILSLSVLRQLHWLLPHRQFQQRLLLLRHHHHLIQLYLLPNWLMHYVHFILKLILLKLEMLQSLPQNMDLLYGRNWHQVKNMIIVLLHVMLLLQGIYHHMICYHRHPKHSHHSQYHLHLAIHLL